MLRNGMAWLWSAWQAMNTVRLHADMHAGHTQWVEWVAHLMKD